MGTSMTDDRRGIPQNDSKKAKNGKSRSAEAPPKRPHTEHKGSDDLRQRAEWFQRRTSKAADKKS
jgi:hypothetical protein